MSDDPYGVQFASAAKRALARLPPRIVRAVVQFIAEPLAENPYRLSKPLRFELEGTRSARRGDYRVLLRIDEPKHIIVILDINHRAHVYRT
ncbi:type II toxin-antitoxin system RelE family toxin [Gordonia neofelifaecis]|uniref:type II toxin-antitoxin system RelE family toxin n=1 Tax=Gordonia neofelifaecis TaxID=945692 RepID=UPI00058E710B|nr:type II toxin-antitoxin system RelE/ParE family toxin [Gordonia neofelifaecis]